MGAYKHESLDDKNKRIFNKEDNFTQQKNSFVIKLKFSGSFIEIKPNFKGNQISFLHDNSIKEL